MTLEEAINRIKDHSYDVIVPDKLPCERYKEAPEVKARVPLPSSTKKVIRQQVNEEMKRQEEQRMRRTYKLMCVALHDLYGFGHCRLLKLISRMSDLAKEHESDEIFWHHVDRLVIQEMGIPFLEELE